MDNAKKAATISKAIQRALFELAARGREQQFSDRSVYIVRAIWYLRDLRAHYVWGTKVTAVKPQM